MCVCVCLSVCTWSYTSIFIHIFVSKEKVTDNYLKTKHKSELDDRTINKFLFPEIGLECLMMFIYRMITGTKWYKGSQIMHTADLIMQFRDNGISRNSVWSHLSINSQPWMDVLYLYLAVFFMLFFLNEIIMPHFLVYFSIFRFIWRLCVK